VGHVYDAINFQYGRKSDRFSESEYKSGWIVVQGNWIMRI